MVWKGLPHMMCTQDSRRRRSFANGRVALLTQVAASWAAALIGSTRFWRTRLSTLTT